MYDPNSSYRGRQNRVDTKSISATTEPVRVAQNEANRHCTYLRFGFIANATYKIGRTRNDCLASPEFSVTYSPQVKLYGSNEVWVAYGSGGGVSAISLQVELVRST